MQGEGDNDAGGGDGGHVSADRGRGEGWYEVPHANDEHYDRKVGSWAASSGSCSTTGAPSTASTQACAAGDAKRRAPPCAHAASA